MNHEPSYTLDALCQEVTRCLEHYGLVDGPHDHRISAVPDGRTVRYYTSLGLLDRPLVAGRQARYAARHLVQLLAIKALQTQDCSLADIQARLFGCSDAELLALVESVAAAHRPAPEALRPLTWHEISIEPGLRLQVQEGWQPSSEPSLLQARILAALHHLTRSESTPSHKQRAPRDRRTP